MELNWLTDHQAVQQVAGSLGPLLRGDAGVAAIEASPHAVPAAVQPQEAELIWADIGEVLPLEWQFLFSLKAIAEKEGALRTFRTPIGEIAGARAAAGDIVAPSGFIFHMSRCGSTLLGNVLGGTPRHLVINQPGSLQDGIWTYLTKDWAETADLKKGAVSDDVLSICRDLICLNLRRRSSSPLRGFIKFRSWAVLFLPLIRRAFPDVPCLFLYRDPNDVLASTMQKQNVAVFATRAQRAFLAGCREADLAGLSDSGFMLRCYASYFESALDCQSDGLTLMNYKMLGAPSLCPLLEHAFRITATPAELDEMAGRFAFYSKSPGNAPQVFDGDRDKSAKRAIRADADVADLNPELMRLYDALEASSNNIAQSA